MKKPKGEFVRCYCCGVCIGPEFHYTKEIHLGLSVLCESCYSSLRKNGYLEVGTAPKIDAFKIMKLNGDLILINSRKMARLEKMALEERIKILDKV